MTGPSKEAAAAASACVDAGVKCLDGDDVAGAGEKVEQALQELAADEVAWLERPGADLLKAMRPEAGRALARAWWLGTILDELHGDEERARRRCLRAMELYGRLRGPSEALDMRAARELGSASARLGATPFSAAHRRR